MTFVIASNKKWHDHLPKMLEQKLGHPFVYINNKKDLTVEYLKQLNPRYVFFPHWSYIIPDEIHENYECVIFHMTDVPFGRGGSPLQNLVARGIYETKISALKCVKELDGGPVYLKRPLSLYGSAEEIYIRSSSIMGEMICEIIQGNIIPREQEGEVVVFKRRKPEEGNLVHLNELQEVFDYIRMLDAEGYPKAFIETDHFRFEFERAALRDGSIHADVKIKRK